ncbi:MULTISPECIES: flagellar export chaperone FliS [Sphingomonadaceae]|jgi:flagellar secretion chaperone FliS|uniref:Flagellar protein FliS n=1 Tax=Sphingobium soli TaxID=1591116 RepID=A0ABS8H2R8_9SPHN|nr:MULTISPECIES: flagellar protein FliS [Sphingomonadaceae]MEC9016803.1 flagellar protein FliS [Pseudomonadota bacterium]EAT09854.1 flagellar protein [Sphingomonas sp. SKA58]MAP44731.1 flagellar export chaperone FliS [Sphingobium sp.]MBA38221.1 flagellar export chaperone FliS [Sphingobium sp.]MBS48290.1 flagellar export chaperone FliS [Sphingobium sp.]|tara:strand:- start:1505 stop:1900 length:396 start_codon:yes stop_codon:yes gene_type:complete
MFYNQGYAGNSAARRYAAVHSGSRTEGATPHGLVKILFDELLLALDAAALAERNGDRMKVSDKQARAMSILFALESSLDFDKGGDVATGLAQIYREARRLLLVGAKERSAAPVDEARAIVAEIAEAWNQIG